MAEHVPDWAVKKIREARKHNLEALDLSYDYGEFPTGRQMRFIPKQVFELRQLKSLSIYNNQISEIPAAIQNLTDLEFLDLSSNQILSLPDELFKLKQLKYLDFTSNQIYEIPAAIQNLSDLEFLDLSINSVDRLPDEIGQLRNLHSLKMRSIRIIELPGCLESLPKLSTLDISGATMEEPEWVSKRTNWVELGLGRLLYGEVPEWVSKQSDLRILSLQDNALESLPQWFSQLSSLEEINLKNPRIDIYPDPIRKLKKIRKLWLGLNDLSSIPSWVGNYEGLESLNLLGNMLSTLPWEMKNLRKLSNLCLSNNRFESIPEVIFELEGLRYLTFDNILGLRKAMSLGRDPERFSQQNKIKVVPERILDLKNLALLDVGENPIETPPLEIVNKGINAIREYYRQQAEQGVDHLYEAKMLVLGEGGAGKTTLAKKIQNTDYQLKDEDSTQGIEVTPWSFKLPDGEDFRVNIWDFGGQEIYHATHQFFLTRRSLYALVADSRKEDTDFNYWLQVVELLSDGSPVLIIKNEKQNRAKEINERELRGRFGGIQQILATNLADNRGLLDVIKAIQYYIADLPHVGASLPKYWVRVREALEKDPHNYISLDTFFEICVQCGFTEEKDMLQLSGYLHDLGVFLHFQDDPVLRNTVILKPRWGTDAVYRVLDDETVRRNKGTFTRADLVKIWSDKGYVRKQYELLQLMMKFRLAYKVPDSEDTYIAPHLLDPNQPEYSWDVADNLYLRYSYEFMPKGILTQFIVLMHEHIREHNCVWKTGVVLEKDGALTEVIEDYDHKEIRVRVAGKNKKALLDIVDFQMEGIHKSYHQLRYDTLIPCRCDACKTSDEPWFYPLARLKQRIIDGQLTIECQKKPYHVVSVSDLLFDIPFGRLEEERRERGGSHMMPDVPGVQEVHYHYGPEEHYDTGGGAVVKGNVDTGGGAFAGRDQITIQTAFDELRAKAAAITDEDTREDLESTLDKLEREAGKGDAANENRIKGYFNFLAEMAPDIWEMVVKTFINPIAGVSTMFQKVAQRAKEELKK